MKKQGVSQMLWSVLLIVSLLLAACGQTPAPAPTEPPSPVVEPTMAPPTSLPATEVPASPLPATALATAAPSPAPAETPELAGLGGIDTSFALYDEPAVDVVPAVQHEPIAPDLSNVRVPFALSDA